MHTPSPKANPTIRALRGADAEALCGIHQAATVTRGRGHYPPEVVRLWSSLMRPEVFTERLPADGALCLVAEHDGEPAGFGIGLADEIRALYVAPGVMGRGVGRALLAALEQRAAEAGHRRFFLNSSLNARGFYEAMGYTVTRQSEFALAPGTAMACLAMEKAAPGA